MKRPATHSQAQHFTRGVLFILLLTASILKVWFESRYPQITPRPWIDDRLVAFSTAAFEAMLALALLSGLWARPTWCVAVTLFSLFAIVTAVHALQGQQSCGCFGAVRVRPSYTLSLDLGVVALLLVTGKPDRGSEVESRSSERGRWVIAGAMGGAWVSVVLGMWLTQPVIALDTTAPSDQISGKSGQTFGNPGELVVLEPQKWIHQHFSLADHIDIGSQLTTGQWIVLLVHHDCDHCAAAVSRYVAEYGGGRESEVVGRKNPEVRPQPEPDPRWRLAVIEMPPFADPADPTAWQLPPTVLSGRLDETRDWFATTPVALFVKDGLVISGKEGDQAETPDPSGWKR